MPLSHQSKIDAPIKDGELTVVVGSGASGLAAARLLRSLGARVRLVDVKGFSAEFTAQVAGLGLELVAGPHRAADFAGAALVVPSPGVPMRVLEPILREAGGPPYMSELGLAAFYTDEPVIAVTGTSGKTTTVSLIAAMLEEGGKKVFLGGNIGTPLSDYVLARQAGGQRADALVLELSSFQLQSTWNFAPHVAALLNLSENHLDQHADMAEYKAAKLKLFALQGPEDLALFSAEDKALAAEAGGQARREFFAPGDLFAESSLMGAHNQSNLSAAWLAAREFGLSLEDARRAAKKFQPLPHRMEKVAEKGGVLYVNDSKCTTVEALAVALASLPRPVILLAGGVFKGGDLESLLPLMRQKVKAVALFGASREKFEPVWQQAAPVSWDENLDKAMARVATLAAPGDAVLLSPATASFDLYANYKERGKHFKRLVEQLNG